jgi:hypothetical protein
MAIEVIHRGKIKAFSRLGKEIKLSPKSKIAIHEPMASVEYHVTSISIIIGIGNGHTAVLSMSEDAWLALKKGKEVTTDNYIDDIKKYGK